MDALELLRQLPKRAQVAVTAADGRLRWRKAAFWRQIPHDHPRRAAISAFCCKSWQYTHNPHVLADLYPRIRFIGPRNTGKSIIIKDLVRFYRWRDEQDADDQTNHVPIPRVIKMDVLELLRRVPKRVQVAVTAADGRLRWRKAAFWRQIPHDHPRRAAIADRLTRIIFGSFVANTTIWYVLIKRNSAGICMQDQFVCHMQFNDISGGYSLMYYIFYANEHFSNWPGEGKRYIVNCGENKTTLHTGANSYIRDL